MVNLVCDHTWDKTNCVQLRSNLNNKPGNLFGKLLYGFMRRVIQEKSLHWDKVDDKKQKKNPLIKLFTVYKKFFLPLCRNFFQSNNLSWRKYHKSSSLREAFAHFFWGIFQLAAKKWLVSKIFLVFLLLAPSLSSFPHLKLSLTRLP